jgi:hypothetical protein
MDCGARPGNDAELDQSGRNPPWLGGCFRVLAHVPASGRFEPDWTQRPGAEALLLLADCIFNALCAAGSTGRMGKSQASVSILSNAAVHPPLPNRATSFGWKLL